jgi:hypothetical protein
MRKLALFLGLIFEAVYLLLRVAVWFVNVTLGMVVIVSLALAGMVVLFVVCVFHLFVAMPPDIQDYDHEVH